MLLPNACIKGATKPKGLLILNSIHVAIRMATDALTGTEWVVLQGVTYQFQP